MKMNGRVFKIGNEILKVGIFNTLLWWWAERTLWKENEMHAIFYLVNHMERCLLV